MTLQAIAWNGLQSLILQVQVIELAGVGDYAASSRKYISRAYRYNGVGFRSALYVNL